jgi:hypothetical protein
VAEYTQESPKRATLSTDGRGCVARSLKKRATERHFNPHQTSFLRVSLGRQWSENQMLRTGGYIIQKNLCTKGKTSAYNLSNKHCIHDKTKLTGKKNKQGKKTNRGKKQTGEKKTNRGKKQTGEKKKRRTILALFPVRRQDAHGPIKNKRAKMGGEVYVPK